MNDPRRPASRILAIALLLAATSCTTVEVRRGEAVSSWVGRASQARKSEAHESIGDARLGGRPVDEFFRRHTAIVSDGGMPRVEFRTTGKDSAAFLVMPSEDGYGSAVSLGDGYFLTAAHVPVKGSGGLFCLEHGKDPVVRRYRVVWKETANGRDVALLHAKVEVPAIPWADVTALQPGAGIYTFGFGGEEWKASRGDVIARKPLGASGHYQDLKMSTPVVCGDSGGPAVTVDGRLAGIITRADHWWVSGFGRAWLRSGSHVTLPDLEVLRGVIAKDKATRH